MIRGVAIAFGLVAIGLILAGGYLLISWAIRKGHEWRRPRGGAA